MNIKDSGDELTIFFQQQKLTLLFLPREIKMTEEKKNSNSFKWPQLFTGSYNKYIKKEVLLSKNFYQLLFHSWLPVLEVRMCFFPSALNIFPTR